MRQPQAGEEVQAFPRLVARDVLCGSAACLLSPGAASSVRNRVASTSPFTKYHLGLHRLAVLATPSVIEITPEIAHPEPLELSRDYPRLLIGDEADMGAEHPHDLGPRLAVLKGAGELDSLEVARARLKDRREDVPERFLRQEIKASL